MIEITFDLFHPKRDSFNILEHAAALGLREGMVYRDPQEGVIWLSLLVSDRQKVDELTTFVISQFEPEDFRVRTITRSEWFKPL